MEVAGGRGDSEALGLAGFTNLDVVRNPSLGSKPYLARYEVHQVVGLTDKLTESSRNSFSLETQLPEVRFEFWVGRMEPAGSDRSELGGDGLAPAVFELVDRQHRKLGLRGEYAADIPTRW